MSITDKKTLTSTRVHDQGKTGLCWDYAASSSVRKSLRIKIGKLLFAKTCLKYIKLIFQMIMERPKHSSLSIGVTTIKYSEKKFFLVYGQLLYQVKTFLSKRRLRVNGFSVQGGNQGLELISDLTILLGSGGFFRDSGLSHLPSIKHIADLLNKPNFFKNVSYKPCKTSKFLRNSKFSFENFF